MRGQLFVRVLGVLVLAIALPGRGATDAVAATAQGAASPRSAEEVEHCVEQNLPDDSSIQTVVLKTVDRIGAENRMRARIYWQKDDRDRSQVLLRFSDPAEMRDSALLLLEREGRNDMFMYLPELRRTRRVTSHMMSGSMFGTDFSYEDFERLQGMARDVRSERLADGEVAGRKVFVLRQIPGGEPGSDYEEVISHIDQEMCVPLRVEFYEKGERLRKVMEIDAGSVSREGDRWVPRTVAMQDLRDETRTSIEVPEIEIGVEIPRKVFSKSELEKGH